MEKSEQFRKEYTYWAEKYMDANKRLTDLLPSGDTAAFIPTEEYVANFKKADRDIRRALDKLYQIADKLYENK